MSELRFYKRKKKINLGILKHVIGWLFDIAVVISIAFILVTFFGVRVSVIGVSMEPALKNGEQLLINKFIYNIKRPQRGDIVVFKPNGNENSHYYVKRIVGLPGETIQIIEGSVYIDGVVYEESNFFDSIMDPGIAEEEITLGEDEYFVLGDNPGSSEDSRQADIGNVRKDNITGKAWFRYQSISDMGFIK